MKPLIIIDAAHGGKDFGGGSNSLFLEKNWSLLISLCMLDLFNDAWKVPAAITRKEDVYLKPADRARIIRDSGAAVCVSNHVNALNGKQSGFEIYHSIHAKPLFAECVADKWRQAGLKPNENPIRSRESETEPGTDYYFLHRLTGPVQTLILEYGYGDNPSDREILAANYQKLAEATVRGVLVYLERAELMKGGNA